ncbi:MAG TPA: YggS family pyridoxal phosphate-dependent enzyme [Vicinamibacterales bacterium]
MSPSDANAIRDGLADVRERIARAASRAGRDPSTVRLVAVSKTFSADDVRTAAQAGQVDFGENKVQEALQKMDALDATGAPAGLRWHLIGHLQSNKARKAAARFDAVHSIDSVDVLRRLNDGARDAGRQLDILVQVDLAGEATKHGAQEADIAAIFAAAADASHVRPVGLMLLPPAVDDPNDARPYFRALQDVRSRLVARGVDPRMLTELSMGMSHDFEVAVEEGATIVRVGTAIFGVRSRSLKSSAHV